MCFIYRLRILNCNRLNGIWSSSVVDQWQAAPGAVVILSDCHLAIKLVSWANLFLRVSVSSLESIVSSGGWARIDSDIPSKPRQSIIKIILWTWSLWGEFNFGSHLAIESITQSINTKKYTLWFLDSFSTARDGSQDRNRDTILRKRSLREICQFFINARIPISMRHGSMIAGDIVSRQIVVMFINSLVIVW